MYVGPEVALSSADEGDEPMCSGGAAEFWSVAGAAGVGLLSLLPRLCPTSLCLWRSIAVSLAVLRWSLRATTVAKWCCSSGHPELCMKVPERRLYFLATLPLLGRWKDGRKEGKGEIPLTEWPLRFYLFNMFIECLWVPGLHISYNSFKSLSEGWVIILTVWQVSTPVLIRSRPLDDGMPQCSGYRILSKCWRRDDLGAWHSVGVFSYLAFHVTILCLGEEISFFPWPTVKIHLFHNPVHTQTYEFLTIRKKEISFYLLSIYFSFSVFLFSLLALFFIFLRSSFISLYIPLLGYTFFYYCL